VDPVTSEELVLR